MPGVLTNFEQNMPIFSNKFLQQVANDAMKYLASSQKQSPPYHSLCSQLNETVCNVSQSANSVRKCTSSKTCALPKFCFYQFLITVHNGMSKQYRTIVRVPVNSDGYAVTDPDGNKVEIQVNNNFH